MSICKNSGIVKYITVPLMNIFTVTKMLLLHILCWLLKRFSLLHVATFKIITMATKWETETEAADFTLGAATWRSGRIIHILFNYGPFASLCENKTSAAKPEVHNILHCHLPSQDWAMATHNMYRTFAEIWGIFFRHDRGQTDKQTCWSWHLTPLLGTK